MLSAFCVMLFLSTALAAFLAFAQEKLKVEKDERLEALEALMPGANCGGCGFAGCQAYAEAVSRKEAEIGLCPVGGSTLSSKMSKVMGEEPGLGKERMTAFVFCKGDPASVQSMAEYAGISDCLAASLVLNGARACRFGCLHLGSCIRVCPVQAIGRDELGNVVVDREKCIGCEKCVHTCPNGVIRMIPYEAEWAVACSNKQKGAEVVKMCKVGCIGCGICVKKYPESGCAMDGFLSVFDCHGKTSQIEEAAAACPKHIIRRTDNTVKQS